MNVLKTILDFILSVGHLFFRGKRVGRKKQYHCPQCGAELRAGRPCGCSDTPDGGCPGGGRGALGVETDDDGTTRPAEKAVTVDAEEGGPSSALLQAEEEAVSRLVGWALMALGVGQWAFG